MKNILFFLLIISISLWGNDLHGKDDIILVRDHYHYFVKDVNRVETEFEFGMGEFTLQPNMAHPNEIEGYIEFHPQYMKIPLVTYTKTRKTGKLRIKTKSSILDNNFSFDWEGKKYINTGSFKLPITTATDLDMVSGMGKADMDLTGIPLQNVEIECGLGEIYLEVNSPNPIQCETLEIETGMGDFEGIGLGNIRAEKVEIEVGLGSCSLNFSGMITENMDIDVNVGLGDVDLYLPRNSNISARINDHFLSTIDVDGLVKDGQNWKSREWLSGRPTISLDLSVGLGSIDVELVD